MAPPRPAAAAVALVASVLLGLVTGLPVATADDAPAPAAPAPAAAVLTVTGATPDGWAAYALADGALPPPAPPGEGFRGEVRFVHDGLPRAVRLLVPPSAGRPAPLLVALHGLYQSPQVAERAMGWGAVARSRGVVLAYGVGHANSWNAGTCCGRAVSERVDDVGYLDRVLAIAGALHPVDPRRRHLAGFSNGAMMSYRYACERPGTVAGVLAVAGTVVATCRGRTDVAVLHVHGLADSTVPLQGLAYSAPLRSPLRPVSRTASVFGPTIRAELLPGYGHGWPRRADGYATTEQGWAFLAAHPR